MPRALLSISLCPSKFWWELLISLGGGSNPDNSGWDKGWDGGGATLSQEIVDPKDVLNNLSFDSFICYQDNMIQCVKQILEGGGKVEYWHSKRVEFGIGNASRCGSRTGLMSWGRLRKLV